jgi:hypothetical protein
MTIKHFTLAGLLALAVAAAPGARAFGLGASVGYNRYSTDIDFNDGPTQSADVDQIGLTLGESITPLFDLAITGGYTSLTFDHHAAANGHDLTGRYIALIARTEPTLIPKLLSLKLGASYGWHDVDNGNNDTQHDELEWRRTALRAGPVLSVGPIEISAGGYWQHYDGTETAHGALAFSRDFGAGDATGEYASIAWVFGDGGTVRLYGETGGRKGVGIVFSTGF